jgi:hypothetical protein
MALVLRSFFLLAFLLSASDFFIPCFGVNGLIGGMTLGDGLIGFGDCSRTV